MCSRPWGFYCAWWLIALVFATAGLTGAPAKKGQPADTPGNEWKRLFDGKTLDGWKQSGFYGGAVVKIEQPFREGPGAIVIERGTHLSGVTWTRPDELPRSNYEITLEAMKLQGEDFFCGLTFPVGDSACSFIVGGWGGRVVGLSSVDHSDASENETADVMDFAPNRWYRIRVRVTDAKIQAWIDERSMVDLETKDRKITTRGGDIDEALPLGISTYNTKAAVRDVRLRRL